MKCSALIPVLLILGQWVPSSLQIQTRCPVLRFQNGRVRARARGRIVRFSCFDGFTLVGNKYSTCVRGKWDTPTPICVNAQCPALSAPEHALVASKYNGAILMFFCEPGYSLVGAGEIYCDGRQWNGTAPHCRDTTAQAPTQCDFEKPDLCWWEQDPLHDFDWRRHNFQTPSSHIGTGPTHDHTLGHGNDGYYLYIEASGRMENDTARIISPLYNSSLSEDACFSFWYHMYGVTIGVLRVYVKTEDDATPRLMFSKAGNQGNQWLRGLFNLPKVDANFQIVIEGVRGASYVSDMAVDDVAILSGSECIVNKSATFTTTTRFDDLVEVVNAQQSCRGRCGSSSGEISSMSSWLADDCHCSPDCAETATCCPDYAEYCVLAFPDIDIGTVEYVETPIPPFKQTTGSSTKDETSPLRNSSSNVIPTDPKDDIDPNVEKPSGDLATTKKPSTTTATSSTTKIPRVFNATTTTTTTTSKPTTTRKITTKITTIATRKTTTPTHDPKETPFAGFSTKFARYTNKTTVSPMATNADILQERIGVNWWAICAEIVGALVAVVMIVTGICVIVKQRKGCKRNGSALSDDSDVRFLTSDEILDFNLARPNEHDET